MSQNEASFCEDEYFRVNEKLCQFSLLILLFLEGGKLSLFIVNAEISVNYSSLQLM